MRAEAFPEEVRCVALPTGDADLLLPTEAVAEVVGYKDPTPYGSAPGWLLGNVSWRGVAVPVVSLAMANADPVEVAHGYRGRLVICFTPSGDRAIPYLGFVSIGPPRLARLRPSSLEPTQGPPMNPFVLYGLTYSERSAWIPDIDAIEHAVLETMQA